VTHFKHKMVAIALASSVVLGTAGMARADSTGTDTSTTVAPGASKGSKSKEYAKLVKAYKAAVKTYNTSKNAIQAAYVKAVKDATAAKKSALKSATTKEARKAVTRAFTEAMKAAKGARTAALTALGAPPTAPTAP
jgi:hypothetical protein